MRIGLNFSNQAHIYNVRGIKNDMQAAHDNLLAERKQDRQDTVSISRVGKAKSAFESLLNQKDRLLEQKNKLVVDTVKNGGDINDIKTQLEDYEEQIRLVDEKLAKVMIDETKKDENKKDTDKASEPKTKEEIDNERLRSIIDLSSNVKQSRVIDSVKAKVDGDANVLEAEIALDKARGLYSSEIIIKKEDKLSDMRQRSTDLLNQSGEVLGDTNEKIQDVAEIKVEDEDDETSTVE